MFVEYQLIFSDVAISKWEYISVIEVLRLQENNL